MGVGPSSEHSEHTTSDVDTSDIYTSDVDIDEITYNKRELYNKFILDEQGNINKSDNDSDLDDYLDDESEQDGELSDADDNHSDNDEPRYYDDEFENDDNSDDDNDDDNDSALANELGLEKYVMHDENISFHSIFNSDVTEPILYDELIMNWKNNVNTVFKDKKTGELIIIDIDLDDIDFPNCIDKILFYMDNKLDPEINPDGVKSDAVNEEIVVFSMKSDDGNTYYGYLLCWNDYLGFENGNCGLNIDMCETLEELKNYVLPTKLLQYCSKELDNLTESTDI